MTIGATAGVDPESFVHSRYIVIWACNIDLDQPAPVAVRRRGAAPRGEGRRHRPGAPPHRRSAPTGTSRIRPGTDGALALALMHVIIGEGLTDEDYVARPHRRLRRARRARARSTRRSGPRRRPAIPADDIRTLAREYATSQPSMIRIGVAIERHAGGGQTVRAISCLPALVGAWRQRRRRPAAAPAVGVPGQLGRADAPGARRRRAPGSSTSSCSAGR